MNARSNGEREQIESGSATEVVMPACAVVPRPWQEQARNGEAAALEEGRPQVIVGLSGAPPAVQVPTTTRYLEGVGSARRRAPMTHRFARLRLYSPGMSCRPHRRTRGVRGAPQDPSLKMGLIHLLVRGSGDASVRS